MHDRTWIDEGDYWKVAGILFIISAPSGSGKSTLVGELRKQVIGVDFSISWTTRPPRGSEENGREYKFTTREEFERMVEAGEFLEHADVVHVGVGDAGDGDVVDVELVPLDEVEQEVEGAVVDIEFDAVIHGGPLGVEVAGGL